MLLYLIENKNNSNKIFDSFTSNYNHRLENLTQLSCQVFHQ